MATNKKTMRHASALKAHRQALARNEKNTHVRSRVKTLTAHVLKEISTNNAEASKKVFAAAQSAWAKAAKRGIVSKNMAARKISRLSIAIAGLSKKKS